MDFSKVKEFVVRALKSKTNWIVAVTFVYSGLGGIKEMLPEQAQLVVSGVLAALAIWFKMNPSQEY